MATESTRVDVRSNQFRFLSWVKEAGREVMRLSRRSSFWSWVRELMQGGSCSMTLSLSKRTLRFVSWQISVGSVFIFLSSLLKKLPSRFRYSSFVRLPMAPGMELPSFKPRFSDLRLVSCAIGCGKAVNLLRLRFKSSNWVKPEKPSGRFCNWLPAKFK